jgi:hypothetical protein
MKVTRRALAGCSFLLLLAAGCGSGPTLGEVEGTVKLNNKALPGVVVQFLPDPEKDTRGPESSATTDENGHYTLTCANSRPGAVVGWHRVIVIDPDEERPAQGQSRKKEPRVIQVYTSPASTPLRHEVKPGGQTINLDLKPTGGIRP